MSEVVYVTECRTDCPLYHDNDCTHRFDPLLIPETGIAPWCPLHMHPYCEQDIREVTV